MKNWISEYRKNYKHLLSQRTASGLKRGLSTDVYNRSEGFDILFENLFQIKKRNFQIIETGTLRNPNNWKDGNSGFLFTELVKYHNGVVRSVDIDKKAVEVANTFIGSKHYQSYCSDSVLWLKSQEDLANVDLFYLDSYDVKWHNDEPSASHHLNEFLAIEPHLENCLVCIDDNAFKLDGTRTGKGRKIFEYLEKKNILPIYDKYQIIYKFS